MSGLITFWKLIHLNFQLINFYSQVRENHVIYSLHKLQELLLSFTLKLLEAVIMLLFIVMAWFQITSKQIWMCLLTAFLTMCKSLSFKELYILATSIWNYKQWYSLEKYYSMFNFSYLGLKMNFFWSYYISILITKTRIYSYYLNIFLQKKMKCYND